MNKYLLMYSDSCYKIKFVDGSLDYENICDGENNPLVIIKLTNELINDISELKKYIETEEEEE